MGSALLETANFNYQNFFSAKLAQDCQPTDSNVYLDTIPNGTEGTLVIDPFTPSSREIIYFNAKTASYVTCPTGGRGYDNTTALQHTSGTTVIMAPIADWFNSLRNLFTTTPQGWTNLNTTLTYAQNNGQKEFVYNTSSDQSAVLPVGSKFNITRTTTPQTQNFGFVSASSQYATKAAPITGMSAWSSFTIEGWVYLNSYSIGALLSMDDTTSGWGVDINGAGQVELYYRSGGLTQFQTYQSVPLGRMVHIAAVVSSVSGKAAAIYFNGQSVAFSSPSSVATAVAQSSTAPLQIGGLRTTYYLDGFVQEVRLWNTGLTQSQVQSNMGLSLTGSETNLIGLWNGNGNANDKTSNGNNMTLTNGAVATATTALAYHATEYAIVTKVTSSQITLFTGTDYVIPNMTVSAQQFSIARSPFGFPNDRGKWRVQIIINSQYSQVNSPGVWYNLASTQLAIPTGAWDLMYSASYLATTGSNAQINVQTTLSTTNNGASDIEFIREAFNRSGDSGNGTPVEVHRPRTMSALTTWYLNAMNGANAGTIYNGDFSSSTTPVIVEATSNYV